jgi:hypothetical protein
MSNDWKDFLVDKDFEFITPDCSSWNDYSDVDAVVAIRNFKNKDLFPNKPNSKLTNAWCAAC